MDGLPPFRASAGPLVRKSCSAVNASAPQGITPPSQPLAAFQGLSLGTVPQNLLRVPASPFDAVSGTRGAARRRVASTAAATAAFAAQRPTSYLEAALCPPKPPSPVSRRPLPLPTSTTCFRCLASDHQVSDCRDPVRCRLCRASGHRSDRCKMRLRGLLRAAARRLRTPAAVRARSAPPALDTQLPEVLPEEPPSDYPPPVVMPEVPPSDYPLQLAQPALESPNERSFRASAAFLPENMLPSSSSEPPSVDVLNMQSLRPLSREPLPLELPCVDKFVVDSPQLSPLAVAGQVPPAAGSGQALDRGVQIRADVARLPSSGEEYTSGELDYASDGSGDSWQEGRPRHADAWVPLGAVSLPSAFSSRSLSLRSPCSR